MRCEWKAAAGAERDVRPHKRFLRKHTRTHTHIRTHLHTHTRAYKRAIVCLRHGNAMATPPPPPLLASALQNRFLLPRTKVPPSHHPPLSHSLSLSFLSLFIRLSSAVPHSSPAQPPALLHSHSHSRPEETSQNLMGICRLTGSYTVRKIKRCHQLLDLIVKD